MGVDVGGRGGMWLGWMDGWLGLALYVYVMSACILQCI